MKKVGILLTLIGALIVIILIFSVTVMPIFKESHAGELNVRVSAFTLFLLDLDHLVENHFVMTECVAFTFFIVGLFGVHRAESHRISN
jgi:type II secretory pathway component PulF